MQPLNSIGLVAHAAKDFKRAGVRYLLGEAFPLDGLGDVEIRGLIAAGCIDYGTPPQKHAARAAERRAALAIEAAKPADFDLSDAELEAATAPAPKRAGGKRA
jgi:hypothetical protein